MIVVITAAAEGDLEGVGDRIAEANPDRALSFVRELRQAYEDLGEFPERFSLVSRHERFGVRRRVCGAYLIFYRIGAEAVEILHVLHGAMDYDAILFPKG